MDPGHSHIVDANDAVAHHFRCDRGLFRNGNIGCPRRYHCNAALAAVGPIPAHGYHSSLRVELRLGRKIQDAAIDLFPGSGNNQIGAAGEYSFGDGSDLLRRLALPEDYLWESDSDVPVMIYPGE